MTQEDKELLLKDICARMPYGVIVNNEIQGDFKIYGICENFVFGRNEVCHIDFDVEKIKPYLFPLSSMTDEQRKELEELCLGYYVTCQDIDDDGYIWDEDVFEMIPCTETDDWLNKNHFDYRCLIPKGLANDATGLNIY